MDAVKAETHTGLAGRVITGVLGDFDIPDLTALLQSAKTEPRPKGAVTN
jgi:hypothetical protein